jgi:hypothetical protein
VIFDTFGLSEMKRWDEVKDAFAEPEAVRIGGRDCDK